MRTLVTLLLIIGLGTPLAGQDSRPKEAPEKPKPEVGKEEKPAVKKDGKSETDAAIATVRTFIEKNSEGEKPKITKDSPTWKTRLPKFPALKFTAGKSYHWNLKTNQGDIKIRFMPDIAPQHVANFVYLTELGFFDGLSFHRVITNFMAQGGDPLGSGRGNPGYRFPGEFPKGNDGQLKEKHDREGLLSMANAGPGTDGSQFFITFRATPHLDGKHTIFGEVVSGMDTVKKLESLGSPGGAPKEPLTLEKATISVD